MAKNTSISLGEHFATFVASQVERGRYSSASDVMRAGLRLPLCANDDETSPPRKFTLEGVGETSTWPCRARQPKSALPPVTLTAGRMSHLLEGIDA